MITPRTVIDNINRSPSSVYQYHLRTTFFSAFKAGWTSLYTAFPDQIRYGRAVSDQSVVMSIRDPYSRFASQWSWLWNSGVDHDPVVKHYRHLLQGVQSRDPVHAASTYLKSVHPIIEHWCGELHLVSQSRALESLLWNTSVSDIRFVSIHDFAQVLSQDYGYHHYQPRNRVPNPYTELFRPIEDLVRETFAQDQRRWESVGLGINNICV